ncbi:aprataxin and PNK-like factor [Anopheles marshallii]|uniref:aprataxin and PNK-like factor n=1 Tax=Anopheles marshallii TaxID=1521116 RepID=UPI00237B350A|nr:aprataxin and PNK-like factor [Anopheles marshallii]
MKRLVIIDTIKQTRKIVPEHSQEIGRGKFLECDDKRISRTHGRIAKELKGTKLLLRLESLHINSIFCQKKDSETDYLLKKDEAILLEVGDKFQLLQDGDWFEVGEDTTEIDSQSTNMSVEMESQNSALHDNIQSKRKHDAEDIEDRSKKQRVLGEDNVDEPTTSSITLPVTHSTDPDKLMCPEHNSTDTEVTTAADVKPDPDHMPASGNISQVQIKPDPDAVSCNTDSGVNNPGTSGGSVASNVPPVSIKPDPDGTNGKAGSGEIPPDSVNPGVLRPSCDFGIRCYRAGQDHRSAFAHPGDLDYRRPNLPPPPPGSPMCPFGARCYRRNPQHFREFDHPDPNAVQPRRPRRYGALRVEDLYNPSDEYDSDDYDDFDPLSSDEYSLGLDEYSDDFASEDDINNDSGLDC